MKTIIIGLDAFDPTLFEDLHNQGKLPNLGKYVQAGGYSRFAITNPAQSEVSWTSIATGQNPGGHGMFDFVHRSPGNYGINVSLLPTKRSLVGLQFTPPHSAETIFEHAVEKGYPATSLWWPATFPARLASPVATIPGLGTPDIAGKLGVGILYSAVDLGPDAPEKTDLKKLRPVGNQRFYGEIPGPPRSKGGQVENADLEFALEFTDESTARFTIGKKLDLTLKQGVWSPVFEIGFKMNLLITLKAVTRVLLTGSRTEPRLYFLPLQIHPLSSAWPYGSPRNFIKKTWADHGPFLTLGWPQDTTGLNEGIITDDQFLALCESILATREQVFTSQIATYREGILAAVFDTLDRVQHMFWKSHPEIVADWYVKLDQMVGRLENRIQAAGHQDAQLLVVSDHGFANFDHKFHLNRWLVDNDYLAAPQEAESLSKAHWHSTKAYAVGLNSLYLNMQGRERDGQVSTGETAALAAEIKDKLLALRGPDRKPVVTSVLTNQEAFEGPLSSYGPDLLIGYGPGYRASAETGTGQWGPHILQPNADHWNADHCIDPAHVPGVIFRNQGLKNWPDPSYRDIPRMIVGAELKPGNPVMPDEFSQEDQETVEDRLKGLGYL
jgi:predicted AlkP superfamily phosphohydrolase/phosphomutase